MTLPLPLVPFEQYMLAENTPEYPRAFVIEVRLSGRLDRGALEAAWQTVLTRHPLLSSLVAKSRGRWQWATAYAGPRTIDWGGADAPIGFAKGEMIDLAREPGVRLWARAGEQSARLVLQFHHSSCDGIAGLQFLVELLAVYAAHTSGTSSTTPLPPLDPELLNQRGTFGIPRPTFREWLGHAATTIRESWRMVVRRIIAIELPKSSGAETGEPAPYPGLERYTLGPEESDALKLAARQSGVTLNDLLMCHLFQALIDWNQNQSASEPRGWLRINVPTNLRRKEDLGMPAANVMSFTFVDRHTRDCGDARLLLESIRAETARIKERRFGLYFIAQLALLAGIPGGMKLMVARRKCFATAVLTNVGDLGRIFPDAWPRRAGKIVAGNMLVEEILGTPPLRDLTRVGIGLMTYAGQLTICVLCDRRCFSKEQARAFLETYLARIRGGLS